MQCKNCGAKLDEGALFCRKCGTSVPETPAQEEKRSVFLDLKPGKRKAKGKPQNSAAKAKRPERSPDPREPEQPVSDPPEPKQESAPQSKKKRALSGLTLRKLLKNRRLMLFSGAVLLLIVLIVVIVSAASCQKSKRFTSPEAVESAVCGALERGDGKALAKMAKLAEPALGKHPETFGEGDTPKTVMEGYYDRLADGLRTQLTEQFGRDFRLESETETRILSGTEIFEPNRALDLEATRYAEITGTLTVGGEPVSEIRIVAAELDGEWKLMVVYVY